MHCSQSASEGLPGQRRTGDRVETFVTGS